MPLIVTVTKSATIFTMLVGFVIGLAMMLDPEIDTRIKLIHYGYSFPVKSLLHFAPERAPDFLDIPCPIISAGTWGGVSSTDLNIKNPLKESVFPRIGSPLENIHLRIFYPENTNPGFLETIKSSKNNNNINLSENQPNNLQNLGNSAENLKTIVYFHGGGLVSGNVSQYGFDLLCRKFAQKNFIVVAVDYRLAPTHPLPAALDDAIGGILWVSLSLHPKSKSNIKLILMGDSAGAYLLVSASQYLQKNHPEVNIHHQVLISPDMRHFEETPSKKKYANGYLLWDKLLQAFYVAQKSQYYGSEFEKTVLAHPLQNKEIKGVGSVEIILSEYDMLHDDGQLYFQLLKSSNIPATIKTYPHTVHGFFLFDYLYESHQAFLDICNNLQKI